MQICDRNRISCNMQIAVGLRITCDVQICGRIRISRDMQICSMPAYHLRDADCGSVTYMCSTYVTIFGYHNWSLLTNIIFVLEMITEK